MQSWVHGSGDLHTYDDQGNVLELIDYYTSGSSEWRGGHRAVISYDADGNLTSETIYQWDADAGAWEAWIAFFRVYNEAWNVSEYFKKHLKIADGIQIWMTGKFTVAKS